MKLSLRKIVFYRVLLCISLVIITYLATAELGYAVFPFNYDKINHLATFLVLALLVDFSFPNSRFNSVKIFSLIAYGFSLEVLQHFLPHRMFSLLDIATDGLGLLAYGLLIPFIKRLPAFSDRWAN
jgi:VanZ family protein